MIDDPSGRGCVCAVCEHTHGTGHTDCVPRPVGVFVVRPCVVRAVLVTVTPRCLHDLLRRLRHLLGTEFRKIILQTLALPLGRSWREEILYLDRNVRVHPGLIFVVHHDDDERSSYLGTSGITRTR